MPEQAKKSENVRGHRTIKEMEAKRAAEERIAMPEERPVKPKHVREWERANRVWNRAVKSVEGLSILSKADTDMLARYCCMIANIEMLEEQIQGLYAVNRWGDAGKLAALVSSLDRTAISLADKLGFTPQSRVRLAVKIAKEEVEEDADLFGD